MELFLVLFLILLQWPLNHREGHDRRINLEYIWFREWAVCMYAFEECVLLGACL